MAQTMTLEEIAAALDNLTGLEASQLSKLLEQRWGVSAAGPVAIAAGPAVTAAAAPAAAEPVEEQTEFDVILATVGDKKINVIKAVRALTNLGLKEAKELVESAPAPVLQAVNKAAAQDAKAKLEAEGATAEVK